MQFRDFLKSLAVSDEAFLFVSITFVSRHLHYCNSLSRNLAKFNLLKWLILQSLSQMLLLAVSWITAIFLFQKIV